MQILKFSIFLDVMHVSGQVVPDILKEQALSSSRA